MNKAIMTKNAPGAIGPYSQAVLADGTLYIYGQLPVDPATGEFVPGGIGELTKASLNNIRAILEEAGMSMADIVKTTVFLRDMNDFAEMNAAYALFFSEPYPARAAVQVAKLPRDARVEIEAIAVRRP